MCARKKKLGGGGSAVQKKFQCMAKNLLKINLISVFIKHVTDLTSPGTSDPGIIISK